MICSAISTDNAFGLNGGLPWNITEELKHFKKLTLGKTLLVGKNTELPPLPGREVIRLSREDSLPIDSKDIFLIGGKTLIDALSPGPYWFRWYLTVIEFPQPIKADTYLYPDLSSWVLVDERVEKGWCRKNHCPVTLFFRVYERL